MIINNFKILQKFVPENFDGDTFYYTEILDRSKRAGNNKGRRIKTFYHRDRAEFLSQRDQIVDMSNYFEARAYFRPSSRSYKRVGQKFAAHLLQQAFAENWAGMRHGYSSICGKTSLERVWVFDFDFDKPNEVVSEEFFRTLDTPLSTFLINEQPGLRVPSKKGFHILTPPFDRRMAEAFEESVEIHFNNPTNLYIPEFCA